MNQVIPNVVPFMLFILGLLIVVSLPITFSSRPNEHQDLLYKSALWGPVDLTKEAYLISLKRRPERREKALKALETIGVKPHLFDAVDGRQYSAEQWKSLGFSDKLSAGMRGCAASHISVWQQAYQKGHGALIFEDDLYIDAEGRRSWFQMLKDFPQGADAIFIGHCERHQYAENCNDGPRSEDASKAFFSCDIAPMCLHAYYLPYATLKVFLASATPVDVPIDVWVRDELMRQRMGTIYLSRGGRRPGRYYGEGAVRQNRTDFPRTDVTVFHHDYTRHV